MVLNWPLITLSVLLLLSLRYSLSYIFTAMLRHGYVPTSLRDCVLRPIIKPGKDPSDSDSYRPIALAPTLSKIFEWCILIDHGAAFMTSSLQFGFKKGLSTHLCTGLIKNVIARYNVNDSRVYGCFLDASKAFDRVNHVALFEKLLQRNLSPVVARALLSWYTDQKLCVSWNKKLSDKFSVSNGVRQGGVLSPILFTVYIDDLLLELEKNGVGCYWNQHFVGAVCYADDIALLAPSPSALRLMLSTCTSFAAVHCLVFNASKTQLIQFSCSRSSDNSLSSFLFNGLALQMNHSVKHLGHILTSNLSDSEDIERVRKDFIRKVNCMLHSFSSYNPQVKTRLLLNFCLSLYGSALWFSSAPALKPLETVFNNVLRRIWSLPRTCHTGILHSVARLESIYNIVIHRSAKLVSSALISNSPLLMDVFSASRGLSFISSGYNALFGCRHKKVYTDQEKLCAAFIRDVKLAPELNSHFFGEVVHMCTC